MAEETILAVDDNEKIRDILQVLLESDGYHVKLASGGKEALSLLTWDTDLIILDVMMPDMSGFKTCAEIRKNSNAPILFLTAKSTDSDKALGFSAGGDDYMVKPFSASELSFRVKALLRRYQVYKGKPSREQAIGTIDGIMDKRPILFHEFRLEPFSQTLFRGEEIIPVTDIEFRILLLLVTYRGRIFSAENLYVSVWEEPYYYGANNTLMVHIRNIRKKIEADPGNPKYLLTVWGKGYRCI